MAAPVGIRAVEDRDLDRVGDVAFVASYHLALAHGLPPGMTSPADARAYVRRLHATDPSGGVLAEVEGEVLGLGWVHPRGPVATLGPLAVDPAWQGRGVGRRLLERCIEIAGAGLPQVRVVHESFDATALGLFLHAGFRVVVPLVDFVLPAGSVPSVPPPPAGVSLRPARANDRQRLLTRDARAFGTPRPQSLDGYLRDGRALLAERGTIVVGYALGIGIGRIATVGPAGADDGDVLEALLGKLASDFAEQGRAVRVLASASDRRLVESLGALGFRVHRACQYMVRGGGTTPPPGYVLMNADMM